MFANTSKHHFIPSVVASKALLRNSFTSLQQPQKNEEIEASQNKPKGMWVLRLSVEHKQILLQIIYGELGKRRVHFIEDAIGNKIEKIVQNAAKQASVNRRARFWGWLACEPKGALFLN